MIYMRDMKSEDLVAIVEFVYHGEVKIRQDTFLIIAKELELKRLGGGAGQDFPKVPYRTQNLKKECQKTGDNLTQKVDPFYKSDNYVEHVDSELRDALIGQNLSGDMKELDDRIEAMIGEGENKIQCSNPKGQAYVCHVCEKECMRNEI